MVRLRFIGRLHALGVAAALTTAPLGGCVNNGQADSAAQAAGQKASRDAAVIHQAIQPALASDPQLAQYVQFLGTRLVDGARQAGAKPPEDLHFYAVVSPVHNVLSPGGPSIYITGGLIRQCENEEDLAASLAHGLAHLIDRHAQRRPRPDSTDPVALTWAITSSAYSSADEAQADRDGLTYFARAGWDPEKFPDILVRLGNRDLSRIQTLRQQAAQLSRQAAAWRKPPVADDRSFPQLQQKAVSTRPPDDRAASILAAFPSCFTPIDQAEESDARKRLAEMLPQPEAHLHHGPGAN